jgi:poly(U)-specific endoribonuclease
MFDKVFESYYREIFSDLTESNEESDTIKEKLVKANPPPDKLVWLRSSAFRIGCQFLSDDRDSNTNLLRCINRIVHAVENTCMEPIVRENEDFCEEEVQELFRNVFIDLSIDGEENRELFEFFNETNRPPKNRLHFTRAAAFRIGVDFLSEERESNVSLLKCINAIVHALEMTNFDKR